MTDATDLDAILEIAPPFSQEAHIADPATLKFKCPNCGQSLEAPEDMIGETADCPTCERQLTVPRPNRAPGPARTPFDQLKQRDAERKPMDKISELQQKANTPQRITIAIITPLILLVFGYGVIDMLISSYDSPLEDFDETWWMWGVVLLLIGGFEFFWFRDPTSRQRTTSSATSPFGEREVKQPSATAVTICSIIGWICIVIAWMALYSGGDWGDHDILDAIKYGNIGYALGAFTGACIIPGITLASGLVIRRHGAGVALIVAGAITIIASFFIM